MAKVDVKKASCKIKSAFMPLNVIFIMSGCPIYSSRYCVINLLHYVHGIAVILAHLVFIHFNTPSMSENKLLITEKAKGILQQFMAIIFVVVVTRNRKKLVRLLDLLSRHLNRQDFDSLKHYAFFLSVAFFVKLAGDIYVSYTYIRRCHNPFESLLWFSVEVTACIYGGVPCFLFVLKAIQMMEKNVSEKLLQGLKKNLCFVTPPEVSLNVKSIVEYKSRLETLFSCIPCCWFFYVFAQVVVVILELQFNYSNLSQRKSLTFQNIFEIVEPVFVVLLLIYLLFVAESVSAESKLLMEKLSIEIIKKNDVKNWSNVMIDLETTQSFELTAWDLFVINKQLLLSFTSSLVTFTVLFVQLVNNIRV